MSSLKKHMKKVKGKGYQKGYQKGYKKELGFIQRFFANKFLSVLILIAIVITTLVLFKNQGQHGANTITIKKQVLLRRSKDLGFIQRGLTGKAVDVNSGKIVLAARVFSLNDSTVYLELDLQQPQAGTLIDYIRYKNGRYIDNGEISVAKADTKNLLFKWQINKALSNLSNGNWKVVTYTNGILAKRVLYVVNNNRVSYVNSTDKILPADSDYKLTDSLNEVAEK